MFQFLLFTLVAYLTVCYLWGLYVAVRLLHLSRLQNRPALLRGMPDDTPLRLEPPADEAVPAKAAA